MSDDALLRLVSAAADGELDPQEQAEVERVLADSTAARLFMDDLQRIEALLSDVPEQAVPLSLHEHIMGAVRAAARKPSPRSTVRLPGLALRYALATAAGVVLTMTIYEFRSSVPEAFDYRSLSGTMIQNGDRASGRVLGRETTRLPEVTGQVELQQADGELRLEIRMEAARTIDLTVGFDGTGLRPVGIAQRRDPFESVDITDRLLRARGLGRHEMSISLRRAEDAAVADEAAIRLEYSSNGRVLKQGSLSSAVE